jgi:hypothetical protein
LITLEVAVKDHEKYRSVFASLEKNRGVKPEFSDWRSASGNVRRASRADLVVLELTSEIRADARLQREIAALTAGTRILLLIEPKNRVQDSLHKILQSPNADFIKRDAPLWELEARIDRLLSLPQAPRNEQRTRRPAVRGGRSTVLGSQPLSSATAGSEIPRLAHVLPELHNLDSGRLDADRIAKLFGLSLRKFAAAIGKDYSAVHKTPDAGSLQGSLAPFERLATGLVRLTGSPDSMRAWINSANPELDNLTPNSLILSGEAQIVSDLVEDALLGQPG